ncbi:MAG: hypothetical protein AB2L24_31650 [Mangrovibacterium sp.]
MEHKETPGLGSKMDTWFNDPEKTRTKYHREKSGKRQAHCKERWW